MDVVFLTGAGSEPAQSIARRLVSSGFRVYGFAAQFPQQGFQHKDFIPVPVNLADPASVRAEVSTILIQETTVTGVIIAGSYPVEEPFESTHAEDISLALEAGVISPLTIVRAVLPMLIRRRGHVIAITRNAHGGGAALAAATSGALQQFTRALFTELRDTGVKAAHIQLAGNPGNPDPAARFTQTPQSLIQPDIIAETVENLLRLRENNALTELVLRPQATREEPRLPISAEPRLRNIQVVQIPPPQNFPPPDEIIHTPERRRPDYAPPPGSEDDDDGYSDDEDNTVDPELLYLVKPNHQRHAAREQAPAKNERPAQDPQSRQKQRPRPGSLQIHPKTPSEQPPVRPPHEGNNGGQRQQPPQDRRQPQPNNGNSRQAQQPPIPYPPNWHWPRPPSPQQLERLARRNKHTAPAPTPAGPVVAPAVREKPPASQEPVREFVPPPPREAPPSDIPEFIPPAFTKAPEPESRQKVENTGDTLKTPVNAPVEEDTGTKSKTKSARKSASSTPAKKTPAKVPAAKKPKAPAKKAVPRKKES